MANDEKADFMAECISDLALSFDGLPINQRLQYVATLLCQRTDDLREPNDPALAVAREVILGVIELLKAVPKVGQWDGRSSAAELLSPNGPR
jgi:hypothetical protein